MTLDSNSVVWNFRSWGRPFRLVSPSLDCSFPETTPVQIECGWAFSTVLTKPGDVYAWWPFGGTFEESYREAIAESDEDESTRRFSPETKRLYPVIHSRSARTSSSFPFSLICPPCQRLDYRRKEAGQKDRSIR